MEQEQSERVLRVGRCLSPSIAESILQMFYHFTIIHGESVPCHQSSLLLQITDQSPVVGKNARKRMYTGNAVPKEVTIQAHGEAKKNGATGRIVFIIDISFLFVSHRNWPSIPLVLFCYINNNPQHPT
jgi:hypothetical protein